MIYIIGPDPDRINSFISAYLPSFFDSKIKISNEKTIPETYSQIYVIIREENHDWYEFFLQHKNEKIQILKTF